MKQTLNPVLLMTMVSCAAIFCPGPTQAQSATEAWVQRYSHEADANDYARKVATDAEGNVIVAGYTSTGITGEDWLIIKYTSAGVPLWTNRYDGPGNNEDQANAVAVDGNGNVFVTGTSYGSGSSQDFTTIAYSGEGVPLWTNHYDGPGNSFDRATAMAVDGSGNVFVTGYSRSGTNASSEDYLTIGYSNSGVPLWTNRYDGPGNSEDRANAVAVDGAGNVFVTGYSRSGSDAISEDYLTIGYSNSGVPLWTNRYDGPGNIEDQASAVTVDGSGNVFVTGYSHRSSIFYDYLTIGYSDAGVPLWTNRYIGPGNGQANAVAVDGSGNVFVTGRSWSSGNYDYLTIGYSGAGVPLWTNRYIGPVNSTDQAYAMAVDGNGNVFVTGTSYGGDSYLDYATIAYSGAGVPLWTNRYNGSVNGEDQASAVTVNGNGTVFVTGSSEGTDKIRDYATIAYSGAGVPLWTNRYNGPGNNEDRANAVAVDGGGNIFVTGYSIGSGSSYDYATIAFSGAGVPLWTTRYNGPGNSEDQASAVAVDGAGHVFVTGTSRSGISDGSEDYLTIGYSSSGVPLWTNRYDGPGNGEDRAYAVAVDGTGNVFVTGYSLGSGSSYDYVTIAYSSSGVPLWTNRYNGPGNSTDQATAVALDGTGNVFVTGRSWNGGYDYATIAYSGAGVPLWTNVYNGPGNGFDQPNAIAVDGNGNVFVTGYSSPSGPGSGFDYATIAYSGAGLPLWTNRYDAVNGTANAQAVAADGSGNVFVTGSAYVSGSSNDYVTVAYSGAGVPLWTNHYNGPANGYDGAQAVAVDPNGIIFVTGSSDGGSSSTDFATIAYSSAGVPLWTNRYNGPANDVDWPQTEYSLAVSPDGVVVVGSSDGDSGGGTAYDFAVVKYITVTPAITTQPLAATTACGSGVAEFSVVASGPEPLSYQWHCNGAIIPGAIATNYIVNPTTPDKSGGYFVVVTNVHGAVTSSVASLTLTNQMPTVATADAFSLSSGGTLVIPPSALIGNDVSGVCAGTATELTFFSFSPTSANGGTLEMLPPGTPLWTNRYNGPGNNGDVANALAVDGNGTVFVTGSSYGSGSAPDYTTIAYSGVGVPLWTNRYDGQGNSSDLANAVAVDGDGNVFVTGYSRSGTTASSEDYLTIGYSNSGVPLWTNRYNGPGNGADQANAVAVDGDGNVFVTGRSLGNGTNYDYLTIAYSNAGVPLWTNRYNGTGNAYDHATALAVDGDGNVFVTGLSLGSGSSYDYATIAYSGGGVPLWINRYNGQLNDYDQANAIAVDGDGNVFVTGLSLGNYYDYATIAYSGAGVPLWTNHYNGPGVISDDQADAVAVDGGGNVFVTGISSGGISGDYATIGYSGAGVPLWTNRYNGPANITDQASAVAVDGSGNVFVTGRSIGDSSGDYLTIAYAGTGVPLWTNRYNGLGNDNDEANAVAVDNSGNVFVTGASSGSGSSADYVTIGYSSGHLVYTPTNGFIGVDTFSYVMHDGYGLTYTGMVSIAVGVTANTISTELLPGGEVQLGFYGIPGAPYVLERTFDLSSNTWSPQQTNTAAANGALTFINLPVGSANFWRIRAVP